MWIVSLQGPLMVKHQWIPFRVSKLRTEFSFRLLSDLSNLRLVPWFSQRIVWNLWIDRAELLEHGLHLVVPIIIPFAWHGPNGRGAFRHPLTLAGSVRDVIATPFRPINSYNWESTICHSVSMTRGEAIHQSMAPFGLILDLEEQISSTKT